MERVARVLSAGLIAAAVVGTGSGAGVFAAQSAEPTGEQWRAAVRQTVLDVLAIHPQPFAKVGELVWRREAEALERDLPWLSEPERLVGLMRLVARIGDGHSQIEPLDARYASWYPVRFYEFSDGYFVTSAHESVRELAGARVVAIAGRPVDEVMDAARALRGSDNEFDADERLYAVHNAFLMTGLGYADTNGDLEVTFETRDGATVTSRLTARPTEPDQMQDGVPVFEWHFRTEEYGLPFGAREEWISAYRGLTAADFAQLDVDRPPYLQQRSIYTRRALPANDAYYVQFNQTDDSGMVGFMGEAFEEIDVQRPRRLIIDIRYNFGGDGSVVNRMIREFMRRDDDRPWQDLYLITGRKTFSAAMSVVDGFLDHTDATLIGEPPGAPLNFSGDNERRTFPELGFRLDVSALTHQFSDSADLRPFVPVDYPAPMSFADYIAGRDPVLDPILAGEEVRSIAAIALSDGGEAASRAYHDRRTRFATLSWYRPPEEFALREVMFTLIAQERHADALAVARLNAEIHPYVWNTWYNLASAQNAAGPPHREQRYASYQCVVLLAPTNWNVPPIQALFAREGIDPEPAQGCPVERD